MRRLRGLATGLATGALGVVVGVAAVLVHSTLWGLLLALAACAAAGYALPSGWSTRVAFAAGWTTTVGVLMLPRAEGDYLVAGDVRGYLLLGWTLALVVVALATVPVRGRRPASGMASG